ncbi:hypothetical protein HK101_002936 [Irineochytrium annulatum]|nr:hypothetical protein HK101_002936 [Irineochytrium annulatum]
MPATGPVAPPGATPAAGGKSKPTAKKAKAGSTLIAPLKNRDMNARPSLFNAAPGTLNAIINVSEAPPSATAADRCHVAAAWAELASKYGAAETGRETLLDMGAKVEHGVWEHSRFDKTLYMATNGTILGLLETCLTEELEAGKEKKEGAEAGDAEEEARRKEADKCASGAMSVQRAVDSFVGKVMGQREQAEVEVVLVE